MKRYWGYVVLVCLAYSACYLVVAKLMNLNPSWINERLFVVTLTVVVLNGVVKAILNRDL